MVKDNLPNTSQDRASKQKRVSDYLKKKIVSGELGPSARLPTHLELVEKFGVSSVTVQRGLDTLRNDGFIVPRGRLGSFVVDAPPHLYRYGLVFTHELSGRRKSPHATTSTRFTDAMAQVALKYADDSEHEIVFYTGVDRDLNTDGYHRLAADIRAHRLAGLIFLSPHLSYRPELLRGVAIPCIGKAGRGGMKQMPVFYIDVEAFINQALDFMASRGRKRVALMAIANIAIDNPGLLEMFHRGAAERGLETGPNTVIGLDPANAGWARNAALMMLNQEPSKRPDGLIISDDHFIAPATQGILESRLASPGDLEVLSHCNFTDSTPEPGFMTYLGFDNAEILRACIRLLDAQRSGEAVPPVTSIRPVFARQASRTPVQA